MARVKCLFCDVENDPVATGGYCDACGKKLPPASAYRSKRSLAGMGDATGSGEPEPALGPRRLTAEAFLGVTVLQLFAGGLFLVLAPLFLQRNIDGFLPRVMLLTLVPTGVFALFWILSHFWARTTALMALGIYILWVIVSTFVAGELALAWIPVHVAMVGLLLWPLVMSQREKGLGRSRIAVG